ncbi:ketoisovalerate reductase [Purpureocillium lavendulum]|uniref:Ketoisovalerate reductase n=1 Tax=Purpureocillium lavendulum TaxID=1247861 RepID=A0AB34FTE0_9HYPO|nr:ketoisovalerate reductase [Purpureocillium lavendulum]
MSHHPAQQQPQQQPQQQQHQQHPPWLQALLADTSPPPKLYAWTPANLEPSPSSPAASSSPAAAQDDLDRRIFILGVGNIGRLYASHLARHPPPSRPPITLVVHRRELLAEWAASEGGIEITTLARRGPGAQEEERVHRAKQPFDIEFWTDTPPAHGPVREVASSINTSSTGGNKGGIIRNLLVATKASAAMPQADRLRRYLDARSAVAFAQNGMCKLWPPHGDAYVAARYTQPQSQSQSQSSDLEPSSASAPSFLACITGHGVYSLGAFRSVHASPAGATIGPVLLAKPPPPSSQDRAISSSSAPSSSPSSSSTSSSSSSTTTAPGQGSSPGHSHADMSPSAAYLTDRISTAPGLDCRAVASSELWLLQLEKLVVNSSINPVSAILRCKNGVLFESTPATDPRDGLVRLFDRLLAETSTVLQALVAHPSTAAILQPPPAPQQQQPLSPSSSLSPAAGKERGYMKDEQQQQEAASAASTTLNARRAALRARFSHERLLAFLYDYGSRVGDNTSSMLQDVRAGRPTEVRDFNGWIVDTAAMLGLDPAAAAPTHRALVDLVESEAALTKDELVERLRL